MYDEIDRSHASTIIDSVEWNKVPFWERSAVVNELSATVKARSSHPAAFRIVLPTSSASSAGSGEWDGRMQVSPSASRLHWLCVCLSAAEERTSVRGTHPSPRLLGDEHAGKLAVEWRPTFQIEGDLRLNSEGTERRHLNPISSIYFR
jgi:hypothetical protein